MGISDPAPISKDPTTMWACVRPAPLMSFLRRSLTTYRLQQVELGITGGHVIGSHRPVGHFDGTRMILFGMRMRFPHVLRSSLNSTSSPLCATLVLRWRHDAWFVFKVVYEHWWVRQDGQKQHWNCRTMRSKPDCWPISVNISEILLQWFLLGTIDLGKMDGR